MGSKCIPVKLNDGSVVMANVAEGVSELPKEDIEALEQWVKYIKERKAKKNAKR